MTYKDIDLEKRTISINKSYQSLDGRDIITPPKTPKSKRIVAIPSFLAEELREYISHLYGIMADERMFRFTKSYMEHEIIRGIKASGVKRIRLHGLRHSHASLLVELGFTPLAIAERLGHEKIEITLNTYSHLYPNKQGELADKLEIEKTRRTRMSGVHKYPTISFRISPREREEIEVKILVSGMSKKDYFVRSCIYNRVCVVGRKELIYQLVEEVKIMQTNIREVTEQFEQTEVPLSSEYLQDMRNECLDMLKAILWMLDGAKYLWQDGNEKSPDSGNC